MTPSDDGAEVRWNIADRAWFAPGALDGATEIASVGVSVNERKQMYERPMKLHETDFSARPGEVTYGRSLQAGSFVAKETHVELGVGMDGRLGNQGWTFDTQRMVAFVEEPAESLGLKKRMDVYTRIGLYAAIGGIAIALLVGVLLVLFLVVLK